MDTALKYIYIHGPFWLGSWEGLSVADICSGLTKVDALHWSSNSDLCNDLIQRKIHATTIGVSVVLGLYCMASSISACNTILMYSLFFSKRKQ